MADVLYDINEEKKFVFQKEVKCTHCGESFHDLRVMNSKLRRLESDDDLRPRFQNIDSLKYGITACPHCGYSAPTKSFEKSISKLKEKLLEEKVTSKFVARAEESGEVWTYDTALSQYKMALICSMAMEDKISDQAYLCLQLSWLIRGKLEEAAVEGGLSAKQEEQLKEDQENFYRKAYDGLSLAPTKEDYPICGMDQPTFDYLLAVLSFHFKDYDQATRYCGDIVQNRGTSAKIKDKALTLKDEVLAAKKAEEEAEG